MIMKVFSIYDGKGKCYGLPFFMAQVGVAARAFGDLVNDDQSAVCKHPADYTLYQVGVFDDESGLFENVSPQVLIGHGSDFAKPIQLAPRLRPGEAVLCESPVEKGEEK